MKIFFWCISATLFMYAVLYHVTASAAELYLQTTVGNIVITDQPCKLKIDSKFEHPFRAYSQEGNKIHEGCWLEDKTPDKETNQVIPVVSIYWPELDASGVYEFRKFKKTKQGTI